MKTRLSIIFMLLIAMIACDKEQLAPNKSPDGIKSYSGLFLKFHGLSRNNEHLQIASDLSKNSLTITNGRVSAVDSVIVSGDSTIVISGDSTIIIDDPDWGWESCATITDYIDKDGYHVTVFDYGEKGCIECGTLIKGKITSKWKENSKSSSWEEIYENYTFCDMTINGTVSYQSDGNPFIDSLNIDDDFEFTYSCQENLSVSFEDGLSYVYTSSYKEKSSNKLWTILEGESKFVVSDGKTYTSEIVEPVVMNFECNNSFIPVSGVEKWNDAGEKYEIDYGDGTCDNIATITENGESKVVDFEEEFNDDATYAGDSTKVGG